MWPIIGSIVSGIAIHADEIALVARHNRPLNDCVPPTVDDLYSHFIGLGHGDLFENVDMARLKRRQAQHWRLLFGGVFDTVYEEHARSIGAMHRARGVGQDLYLQGYGYFTDRLLTRLDGRSDIPDRERAALARAVVKFVFFDLTAAMSTYHVVYID